jgi:hypothetical protein
MLLKIHISSTDTNKEARWARDVRTHRAVVVVALAGFAHDAGDGFDGGAVEVFHDAGVGVAAERGGGVSKQFLHDLDVHPSLEADGGGDVAQVVEPDLRKTSPGGQPSEALGD